MAADLAERLIDKCRIGNDCWTWVGARSSGGYGSIWVRGSAIGAHRAVFELIERTLDPAEHLDHLCNNRACVHVKHLDPVTRAENIRRRDARIADRCGQCDCQTAETTPDCVECQIRRRRRRRLEDARDTGA